jgi:site-specific DNA-cytosine methylase
MVLINQREKDGGKGCEQTKALELDPKFIASFDAVHASPPCQAYSDLAKRNGNGHKWPRLIEPIRRVLIRSGLPYVIENVDGAPLNHPDADHLEVRLANFCCPLTETLSTTA